MKLITPKGYNPKLSVRETQIAIKMIKDFFENVLAEQLCLTRVSAPFFVFPETGLNDNLTGKEHPVSFGVKDLDDRKVEVVHSLAKWKRYALKMYGFADGEGLYTDMNAIRRDEELDNLHSIYVDQWDWERIIKGEQRNNAVLEGTVRTIYGCFKKTEELVKSKYPFLDTYLPENITFITSQELEDAYPHLTPKQREDEICKKHRAVFLTQIGGKLNSGEPHDGRSPDYDDWMLNGDMLFYYPLLERAFEVMSMGIRVDARSLKTQLELSGALERLQYPFHKMVSEDYLPLSIGGGLGQSRICMFLLNKAHIGEVQAAVWSDEMREICREYNINLL